MMSAAAYIAELAQSNQQLRAENALLRERVAHLERLLEQALAKIAALSVSKTSQNSSLPPSKDLSRKTGSLRQKSGKKAGGQLGHPGHTLLLQAQPDKIEALVSDYCTQCGSDIRAVTAVLKEKRQVIDLPVLQPVCTQYEQYERICPRCSHRQRPDFPAHVTNHIQYGEQVHSLAVYLNVRQYLPYKRMQEFFAHCCQLPISTGTLENIQGEMAQKGQAVYEALRQRIAQAPVVGADETGVKVNGKNYWAWTWQNKMVTFIAISVSRGAGIIRQLFPQGLLKAVLLSDRWKPQLATAAKAHQLCLAHLLRELNYLHQLYGSSRWAADFSLLLRAAMLLKQVQAAYQLTDPPVQQLEKAVDQLLTQAIDPEIYPKLLTFQRSMITYRQALLTFLYQPLVEYDNNGSERAIRNFKVKLKVSGQFKSAHNTYCVLRSIIDTAIKNKQPVMHVCKALFRLQPVPAG